MYSEYGFVLNGIEYATEAEAREALAEMQAKRHIALSIALALYLVK